MYIAVIEWLYSIDLAVFRFGNSVIANPIGDAFFPFITEVKNFYIVFALVGISLLVFGKKKGAMSLLLLAVTIALSDQISSHFIKPLVGRLRPCHVLEGVRLLVGCGGGKSFTSSHAANNFAMAVIMLHFFPKAKTYLLIWASLVTFSRVYVGVHYPSDIVAGAILGSLIGLAVILAYEKIVVFIQSRKTMAASVTDGQQAPSGRTEKRGRLEEREQLEKREQLGTEGHAETNDAAD